MPAGAPSTERCHGTSGIPSPIALRGHSGTSAGLSGISPYRSPWPSLKNCRRSRFRERRVHHEAGSSVFGRGASASCQKKMSGATEGVMVLPRDQALAIPAAHRAGDRSCADTGRRRGGERPWNGPGGEWIGVKSPAVGRVHGSFMAAKPKGVFAIGLFRADQSAEATALRGGGGEFAAGGATRVGRARRLGKRQGRRSASRWGKRSGGSTRGPTILKQRSMADYQANMQEFGGSLASPIGELLATTASSRALSASHPGDRLGIWGIGLCGAARAKDGARRAAGDHGRGRECDSGKVSR